MTRKQWEQVVEGWRQRLVPEFDIVLDWTKHPDDDDHTADVDPSADYHHAFLRLMPGWLTKQRWPGPSRDRDYEREVDIVHELLHVLDRDRDQFGQRLIDANLVGQARDIAKDRHKHYLEGETERLARLLVLLSPLRAT